MSHLSPSSGFVPTVPFCLGVPITEAIVEGRGNIPVCLLCDLKCIFPFWLLSQPQCLRGVKGYYWRSAVVTKDFNNL